VEGTLQALSMSREELGSDKRPGGSIKPQPESRWRCAKSKVYAGISACQAEGCVNGTCCPL